MFKIEDVHIIPHLWMDMVELKKLGGYARYLENCLEWDLFQMVGDR